MRKARRKLTGPPGVSQGELWRRAKEQRERKERIREKALADMRASERAYREKVR